VAITLEEGSDGLVFNDDDNGGFALHLWYFGTIDLQ
jgi:hypothetical protein